MHGHRYLKQCSLCCFRLLYLWYVKAEQFKSCVWNRWMAQKCLSQLNYKMYSLEVVDIFAPVTTRNNVVHSIMLSFLHYLCRVQVNVPSLHNCILYISVVSPLHSKHLRFLPFLFLCKALKRNQSEGDKARAIWSLSGSQSSVSGTQGMDGMGGCGRDGVRSGN